MDLKDIKIEVCDKCFKATCWQYIFICDEYKEAGITEKTVRELLELKREHPSYWLTDWEEL